MGNGDGVLVGMVGGNIVPHECSREWIGMRHQFGNGGNGERRFGESGGNGERRSAKAITNCRVSSSLSCLPIFILISFD